MNHTAKHIILILIGFLINHNIVAQDTLLLDLKNEYYKDSDTVGVLEYYAKNIYSKADYSRELIQFTKDSAKLEYCFYYDSKRYGLENRAYHFSIKGDSLLHVDFNNYDENWRFEYVTDSLYRLKRMIGNLVEFGYAKRLFPLEKIGNYYTLDSESDTLWTIKYSEIVFPALTLKEQPINDSVYVICDSMPTYPVGLNKMRQDLLGKMQITMPIIESSTLCTRVVVSFVIDKNGDMKDIRVLRSCDNGFVERAILISLHRLDRFTNGFMDNEPVNIRFTLPIHINLQ